MSGGFDIDAKYYHESAWIRIRLSRMSTDMERRAVLLGLLSAAALLAEDGVGAQESPGPPDPSLYIPKAHVVGELTFLHDFMEEFSFVMLVTATPALRITHIPSILDRTQGRFGTLRGHVSAQNAQKAALDGTHQAVVVFRGPQGYISPTWYATRESVVPTWNFGVVHASGRPRPIADKGKTHDLLATLIARNEKRVGSTTYDFAAQPQEYVDRMMQGISPFEMEIEALEGKFKLGQERSEGDRNGVLAHLARGAYSERSLYDLTQAFYKSPPK
jgi:transcriptional regulator